MTGTTLDRSVEIPAWIRRPKTGLLLQEGIEGPMPDSPAIMDHTVSWRHAYAHPILNPSHVEGQIALLYEFGIYIGAGSAVRGDHAASGWRQSKWWAKASPGPASGWYDWDGNPIAIPDVLRDKVAVGDEVIIMQSTNVSGLMGERRPVTGVGHSTITVPAMGVKNDGGFAQDTWIVHQWVKIPSERKEEEKLTAAMVEERISDVLMRIRRIAVDYCEEYEEVMQELGFREQDYRKGGPVGKWLAEVELTYNLHSHDLADVLEKMHGGAHNVKEGVRVISQLNVQVEWDGRDETERDDLIEAAVSEGMEGFDDIEILEVTAL